MSTIPQMSIRQPLPGDIVDDPIQISGLGTAFEGVFRIRVRDANEAIIGEIVVQAGGIGRWANFQTTLPLEQAPETPQGRLIVFELPASGGGPVVLASVPVILGRALIPDYSGFTVYTVQAGDTLTKIAREFYEDETKARIIFEANRDRIENPDLIVPGQELRLPQ